MIRSFFTTLTTTGLCMYLIQNFGKSKLVTSITIALIVLIVGIIYVTIRNYYNGVLTVSIIIGLFVYFNPSIIDKPFPTIMKTAIHDGKIVNSYYESIVNPLPRSESNIQNNIKT